MDEPRSRPGGPDLRGSVRDEHILERPLPATPASTVLARMTARVACRAWRVPQIADDGVLLASELTTAALRATGGVRVVLRVLMTPRRLRIEVHDPTGRLAPPEADDDRADDDDPLALNTTARDHVPLDPVQRDVLRALTCRHGVGPSGPGTHAWGELPLGG